VAAQTVHAAEEIRPKATVRCERQHIAAQAASAGHSRIHVVTEERARNVRFYEKNEFRPLATSHWNGADVVFMAV
jgi:hypothetical protein